MHASLFRRFAAPMVTALSLSAALAATSTVAAAPAVAAQGASAVITNCTGSWAEKKIALPGKPDLLVEARVCVLANGNYRKGRIQVRWSVDGLTYGVRFDKFVVQTRLERHDRIHQTENCDYEDEVNNQGGGSETCETAYMYSSVDGGWTGDGKIVYDVNNDGKGAYTWDLGGSPSVLGEPLASNNEGETTDEPAPDPADMPEQ
ncbi:hypothetical protein FXF51_53940 [Nonomuraea sp. PA05]|uniref:hypothetical protein n=1 Tax=Nonomuraea sp. PA05 TaxID=2604466 RepID=UPI0011D9DBF1|nr:hypothetical protein [Nonomuraea sp. PA05]TYB51244.1 hypothetical protein FXF51_53940 [Nonomuraea sp. PA05]